MCEQNKKEKHTLAANMSERKAVIKNADMSEEMQQDAVDCATQALEKYNIEKVCSAFDEFSTAKYLSNFGSTCHLFISMNHTINLRN